MAKSKIPDSFTKVTPLNRKFCIIMGRECFVTGFDGKIDKEQTFMIRPRLKHKGWFQWNENKCFVETIESAEDYAQGFDDVITTLIKAERLYVDTTKKLITFKYNEKK